MFPMTISELLKEFADHRMDADVQLKIKIKNPNSIQIDDDERIINITKVSYISRNYGEGEDETVFLEGEIR